MTTRRSRLQIRPNIGRGAKETGNDTPVKKTSAITSKSSPRKEVKENTRFEGNNLTEQKSGELICNKVSPQHIANDKELTLTETDSALNNVKKCHHVSNAPNCASLSSNEVNAEIQKSSVISENYTTLLNTNRECTVVLDRTIITTRKHVEEMEACSTNVTSEDCTSIEKSVVKPLHEKEQKCEGREQPSSTQQNAHDIGIRNKRSLHSSSSDAEKEKNIVKSKENMLREDNSADSSGISQHDFEDNVFAKPIAQSSVVASSEKKSSNKVCNGEEISRRRNRFSKKPPERGIMTMMDLIFWNPPNNPMSTEGKTGDGTSEEVVSVLQAVEEEEEVDNTSKSKDGLPLEESLQTETEELPGPRVMIGPNGEITIDEDSLVIRRIDPEQNASKDIVHEVAECTYNSFRKPRPKHYWTDKETAKFYKALSIVGTDFSLMLNLFPKRKRQELKNKFKREEKLNRHLVDRAIRDPQQFDLTAFDDDDDDDEESEEETRNGLKRAKRCNNRKKYKRKKRVKNKGSFEDDISDDDALIVGPVSKPSENVGIRKSTRKRKETSKEIPIYSTAQVVKKRQAKPRISKPKKKAESTPVECEYESLEILEIPNENLEVVTEDQSVIVCHSPLASEAAVYEEAHRSDMHVNTREAVQNVNMQDTSDVLKQTEQLDANNVKQPNTPVQELFIKTPTVSNNVLQAINSSQSNLTPGQLVLVAGKTNNVNEQVVHVYVVSQPSCAQESLIAVRQSNQHIGGTSSDKR